MVPDVNSLCGLDIIGETQFKTFTAYNQEGTDKKIYFFVLHEIDLKKSRVILETLDPTKFKTQEQIKEYAKQLKDYGATYKVVLLCTTGKNHFQFSVSNLIKDQIPKSKLDLFVRDGNQIHPICKVNVLHSVDGEKYTLALKNYAMMARLLADQMKKIQAVAAK